MAAAGGFRDTEDQPRLLCVTSNVLAVEIPQIKLSQPQCPL